MTTQNEETTTTTTTTNPKANMIDSFSDLDLLELFKHMPLRDLASCSQVCRKWHTLAREELASRRHGHRRHCRPVETFMFDSRPSSWLATTKKHLLCIDRGQFERDWSSEASQIYSPAQFCILTCNSLFLAATFRSSSEEAAADSAPTTALNDDDSPRPRQKRVKYSSTESVAPVCAEIPGILGIEPPSSDENPSETTIDERRRLEHVLIVGYGLIATNLKRSRTLEIENDFGYPAFGGILFPKSDRFRFQVVSVSYEDAAKIKSVDEFKRLLGVGDEVNGNDDGVDVAIESIRWLMLLTKSANRAQPFLNQIRSAQEQLDFACSGGIPSTYFRKFGKILKGDF